LAAVFAVSGLQFGAEALIGFFTPGKADHLELRRQVTGSGDVVKGGDELTIRQVAGGTKNDDSAGLRTVAGQKGFLEGIFLFGHGFKARNTPQP
jgi:hypothetical protein